MKDFLKFTFATVAGIIVTGIIMTVMAIISLAGMIASSSTTTSVGSNSVFVLKLDGNIDERAAEDPFSNILGGTGMEAMGLDDILESIEKAKNNDDIKGIYIEAGSISVSAPAMLQEIRDALLDFKKSGKFIYSYGDSYSQGAYYLCSVADKVMINPEGDVMLVGMASQPMFYKELLDKVGVKMQVFKVGTYKSAVEPYIQTEMSDANREQITQFVGSIWGKMTKDMATSRKISVDSINAYADRMAFLWSAEELKKAKLVDEICYTDEPAKIIRKKLGLDEKESINTLYIADMKGVEGTSKNDNAEHVAVYYAYGEITSSVGSTEACIDYTKVCKDIRDLAEDDDVKAVVLRINSPGGSAYASEQIWHDIELLKAKKPVVVSMGGLAASGGYYIASGANWIIAEPTTLTGSIGIFGLVPDVSGLVTDKLGLHFDQVCSNKHSDFGTMARGFDAEECAAMQAYVERGYKTFTSRVAKGRKMTIENVDKIGQGRVWTGEKAKQLGLVDEIGDLNAAIAKACVLAKIDKATSTVSYPEPASWMDNIMTNVSGTSYIDAKMRETLGDYYSGFTFLKRLDRMDRLQARMPFDLNLTK